MTGSRHRFIGGGVKLDDMIAFYKKPADSVDKWRTKDSVRSNLVSFFTLSLIYKLIENILDN